MYQTTAIIIKKEGKGENDGLFVFFSQDYGKIKLLAKGVRKNSSKLKAHLNLFSVVDITFVLGRTYNILTSAIEIENFKNIKNDLRKLKIFKDISDLFNNYTFYSKKDGNLFRILLKSFFYISEKSLNEVELDYFLAYVKYKFLSVSGYKPKEKKFDVFFTGEGFKKNELESIKFLLKRYFKNIFDEV